MIVIAGRVTIDPSLRAEAIERTLAVAAASEAESGCRSYRVYADLEAEDTFFVFEEWESEADLAAHFQTAHLQDYQAHLPRFVRDMDIRRYDVAATSPL